MSSELRDMGARCERCGALPGMPCKRVHATSPGLRFVFPCGTSMEDARQALSEASLLLAQMEADSNLARWADDGGTAE